MFELCVESDFSAAHFLSEYSGKCERLHGHNYRVLAYVRGDTLDESGMLLDFSILKKCLRNVCAQLDHCNLNDLREFKNSPSAERLAKYIFERLRSDLINENASADLLYAVDIYETRGSRARYFLDGGGRGAFS